MAFDHRRIGRLAAGAVLVVVLLAASRLIPGGGKTGAGESPGAAMASPAAPARGYRRAGQAGSLVHVAGAVRRPGVYRLAPDSRVRDAVRKAGGAGARADLDAINLAARLTDGQQVVVPARAPTGSGVVGGAAGDSPVSLGSATAEELDGLDGVGPAIARKIVEWRTEHGGIGSIDDLDQVPGIGPKKLEALRGQLSP